MRDCPTPTSTDVVDCSKQCTNSTVSYITLDKGIYVMMFALGKERKLDNVDETVRCTL